MPSGDGPPASDHELSRPPGHLELPRNGVMARRLWLWLSGPFRSKGYAQGSLKLSGRWKDGPRLTAFQLFGCAGLFI